MEPELIPGSDRDTAVPTMMGLERRCLRLALIALACSYLVVRGVHLPRPADALEWVFEVVGGVGLLGSLALVAVGDADPLPIRRSVSIAVTAAASLCAAWWAIPDGDDRWVLSGAPLVVFVVVAGMLALRGRAVIAWTAGLASLVIAAKWGPTDGAAASDGFDLMMRAAATLVPATLVAMLLRPVVRMSAERAALRTEQLRLAAASEAIRAERAERLRRLDRGVTRYLADIAGGYELAEPDARRAHLLGHDLRDEVRGRRWHAAETRSAIERARERGLSVRVLDDGAEAGGLSAGDLRELRRSLVITLDSAAAGALTARILPSGREHVAVVNLMTVDGVQRTVWRRGPDGGIRAEHESVDPVT